MRQRNVGIPNRSLRAFFRKAPPELTSNESSLDKLRILRNGIAHTFGRTTDDYDSLLESRPKAFATVSIAHLKSALSLVESVAVAVDKHLGDGHVGEYESLYSHHRWDKIYNWQTNAPTALRHRLFKIFDRTRELAYYRGLIEYYDRA